MSITAMVVRAFTFLQDVVEGFRLTTRPLTCCRCTAPINAAGVPRFDREDSSSELNPLEMEAREDILQIFQSGMAGRVKRGVLSSLPSIDWNRRSRHTSPISAFVIKVFEPTRQGRSRRR